MSSSATTARGRRSIARSSSSTRFFVTWKSQVVNRERSEKPGRPWKTRRKTSWVRSSASDRSPVEPQHVVEDRLLVRPDDDRERSLVAPLGLAQDSEVGLWERHVRGEYRAVSRKDV